MGGFLSNLLSRKPPEEPIKSFLERLKNIFLRHYRGIFGVLITVIDLSWQLDFHDHPKTSVHIWTWMSIFYLCQPVSIQITSMIPIFALPMLGIQETAKCVKHYWNEGASLFIVGGMLHLLLNNSGLDRRLALAIICKGSCSPMMLLLKASAAAFIMSAISHRLIVASTLIQYITPIFVDLHANTARYRASEPNYEQIRYIINNGIQTSCSIGGLAIIHASYCTLAFRAIFAACVPEGMEYPDMINYLQYTAFALPLSIVMFIVNFLYHAGLLKFTGGKPISDGRTREIETALKKNQDKIPAKITNHEKWTILFQLLAYAFLLSRWNEWTKTGWAEFSIGAEETIPKVKDATTAAAFVILLHVIPRSYGFIKIVTAKKKSELPPLKPESAILFWRFVDKNTNYGYFFVMGAGIALWAGANTVWTEGEKTTSGADIIHDQLKFLKDLDFEIAILVIILISIFLCNIMSGMAAVSLWLPAVLCLRGTDEKLSSDSDWKTNLYRPALAVGLASSMGFMSPFLYTPAYFCHHTGKVPILKMMKHSLLACVLAGLVIWAGVAYLSPMIFTDSFIYGTAPTSPLPYGVTTPEPTEPPAEGGGGGGEGGF